MRALGLDLGTRRVGVAVCGPCTRVAVPVMTLTRTGKRDDYVVEIAELVQDREVDVVVVGLPLSLSGRAGPAVAAADFEIRRLRRSLSVPVVVWDERFTTRTAERKLSDIGLETRKQRSVVDQLAAATILQTWVDAGMPMAGEERSGADSSRQNRSQLAEGEEGMPVTGEESRDA